MNTKGGSGRERREGGEKAEDERQWCTDIVCNSQSGQGQGRTTERKGEVRKTGNNEVHSLSRGEEKEKCRRTRAGVLGTRNVLVSLHVPQSMR